MFFYINFSSVFGGQERYLQDSIQYLNDHASVGFIGSPFENTLPDVSAIPPKSVVVLNGNSALYKYLFKLPTNLFKVYVQHSNINDGQATAWKTWVRKVLLKVLLMRVDLVIRVCDNALPDFYAPNKIKTIYNGVHLPQAMPVKQCLKPLNLLMVGAINSNKNQKLAIEALVELKECQLTLVGRGPEEKSLQDYAKSLGVAKRVVWAGFHEDPTPFYQQADLLLMLSRFEAFPYVVLEAMAQGVPVVAVPVGGVPEIIKTDENSFLIRDYFVSALVEKIQGITPEQYLEVSRSARQTIESGFTIEHMMQQFMTEVEKGCQQKFGETFVNNSD
jgi:glycosyltransferase involved in cell wall biosynthesis